MGMDSGSWPAIRNNLQNRLRKQQFDTWFQQVEPIDISDNKLNLRVPNSFCRDWLNQRYNDVIADTAAEITGNRPQVVFTVDENQEDEKPISEPQTKQTVEPTVRQEGNSRPVPFDGGGRQSETDVEIRLNDLYTFDNFVVGPSNNVAHAAASSVADAPGYVYNPLFMHGSVGLGKSHLIQAAAHGMLKQSPRPKVLYMSCENFMNQFIKAIRNGNIDNFRYRYRHVDALMIDDIQFITKGDRTQEEFFHTFNTLYNAHKQIVLTCDRPPKDTKLERRMVSRFKSGMVVKIDPPRFETRVAIVKKKAELRHCHLPDDVIGYIAENIDTNIREIEGAIITIQAVASVADKKIDIKLAKSALAESIQLERKAISIEDIQNAVIKRFGVKLSDLQSKKRTKSIAMPRHICMYLARKLTSYSLGEIGGYFGGRDHSTVLHAVDKIEKSTNADPTLLTTIKELTEQIRSPR